MAEEDGEFIAVDFRGHAGQVGPAVYRIVKSGDADGRAADAHARHIVDQRCDSGGVHDGFEADQVAFGNGAVMIAQHAANGIPRVERGSLLKEGDGLLRGIGVIAAEQNQIGLQRVDAADQLIHAGVRKEGAAVDIGEINDAQRADILRKIGTFDGDGLRFQHEGLGKGPEDGQTQKRDERGFHEPGDFAGLAERFGAVAGLISHEGLLGKNISEKHAV